MKWALTVESVGSRFIAKGLTADGVRRTELKSLVSDGLPRDRSARVVLQQNLTEWHMADPGEYLRPFGLQVGETVLNRHAVYEAVTANERILIPALAVMRAFFRPTRYLLPQMFCPQALDRVRLVNRTTPLPTIQYLSDTWRSLESTRYGDVTGPLSWMTFFKSAARFASSVHDHAREGRIALDPPMARARIALWGARDAGVFRATHLTVLHLEAAEPPLDWAGEQAHMIYRRPVGTPRGRMPELRDPRIPARADGSVTLSDDEWAEIEPVLFPSDIRHRRLNLPPRLIFDGLLRKLAHGTAWRNTEYPVGGHLHARYWHRRWNESGRFAAAVERLVQLRMRITSG